MRCQRGSLRSIFSSEYTNSFYSLAFYFHNSYANAHIKKQFCCYGLVLDVFKIVPVINQTNCILFIGQWEPRDQKLVKSYPSRVKVNDRKIYVAQLTNQIACYIVRWREHKILLGTRDNVIVSKVHCS